MINIKVVSIYNIYCRRLIVDTMDDDSEELAMMKAADMARNRRNDDVRRRNVRVKSDDVSTQTVAYYL